MVIINSFKVKMIHIGVEVYSIQFNVMTVANDICTDGALFPVYSLKLEQTFGIQQNTLFGKGSYTVITTTNNSFTVIYFV